MRPFTVQAFRELIAHRAAPAISIFQPTHRGFPASRQNPIRYRDLVKKAAEMLKPYSNGRGESARWVAALEQLLTRDFWEHPLDGLAVFVGPGTEVYYRLPRTVPEDVFVEETFHTKPLLDFLRVNRRFYLLTLSQKRVALYSGDPFRLEPIELHGVPQSMRQEVGDLVEGDQLGVRAAGGAPSIFYGQSGGLGDEQTKRDLEHFFRAVDRSLRPMFNGERAPLLVAGVGYYHPIFRSVSRLPNLAQASLVGNFDTATTEQLHSAAWPAILTELKAMEDQVIALHEKLAGTGRVANDLDKIAEATMNGRVRYLLLEENARIPGRFDPGSGSIVLSNGGGRSSVNDVLDDLAEQTLLRGGETIVIPAARMPVAAPASAGLRW